MNAPKHGKPRFEQNNFSADDGMFVIDPWEISESDASIDSESWLLGYVDFLTLMLTLVVLLLAYHQVQKTMPERPGKLVAKIENPKTAPKQQNKINDRRQPQKLIAPKRQFFPPVQSNFAKSIDSLVSRPEMAHQVSLIPDKNAKSDRDQTAILDLLFASLLPNTEPLISTDHDDSSHALTEQSLLLAKLSESAVTTPVDPNSKQQKTIANYQNIISTQGLGSFIDINQGAGTIRLEVNESILFAIGSAELKPQGLALLRELAEMFKQQPGTVDIEGHTDNIPINTEVYPSNWELASGRATAVARYLIEQAIDPRRLRAIGFADTKPRAKNDTALGRSKNRRVSLVVTLEQPDNRS